MDCYKEIERVIGHFKITEETLKKLNELGKNECENISKTVSFEWEGTMDLEQFIVDRIALMENYKLEKKLKVLEVDNMWDRWERGGEVTKRELVKIIGRSVDVIDKYCRKSQSTYLKSKGGGKGVPVTFKKEYWDAYSVFLER